MSHDDYDVPKQGVIDAAFQVRQCDKEYEEYRKARRDTMPILQKMAAVLPWVRNGLSERIMAGDEVQLGELFSHPQVGEELEHLAYDVAATVKLALGDNPDQPRFTKIEAIEVVGLAPDTAEKPIEVDASAINALFRQHRIIDNKHTAGVFPWLPHSDQMPGSLQALQRFTRKMVKAINEPDSQQSRDMVPADRPPGPRFLILAVPGWATKPLAQRMGNDQSAFLNQLSDGLFGSKVTELAEIETMRTIIENNRNPAGNR